MPRTSSHRDARGRAQAVTTARRSQDEDRNQRMRRYLLAMAIRTACFPLAVWAYASGRYVLAGVAAVGAAVIPTFAVMLANAVDRRSVPTDEVIAPVQGLGPGRSAAPGPEPQGEPEGWHAAGGAAVAESDETPIRGKVISSRDTAYPVPGAASTHDEEDGQ
ncbi:DUF3099 domain-containing protein [Ornithinimicrobium pratense]|uniref:DUF3099 domain-containing protein n=1 Tax=Ornithinimicrobium pratense TaxID=2593973 RepID=A0A5J6V430_9MICO|nr:DUF3099 domain-containing protein [Ornithinimicrobium pratense]QFG68720.1 DUF3099 domain-containing protein [Ornithinimicrobium pratense]